MDEPAPARTYTAPPSTPDLHGGDVRAPGTPNAERGDPSMFDDMPLSLWQQANEGMPYAAEHFGLQNYFGDETFIDMANDMLYLDWYVQKKIAEHGLEDSQDSFRQVVGEIVGKIGSQPTEKSTRLFTRIVIAVKALERLDSVKINPGITEAPRLEPAEIEGITSEHSTE